MARNVLINFVMFQLAWFACVLSAAHSIPWLGVSVTFALVMYHLKQAKQIKPEIYLLLIAILIGACFDQIMVSANLVRYQAHGWSESVVPVWILALWACFVTALNVSLRWMRGKWLLAIGFGAIGGPLAYIGAARIGAVSLNFYPQTYLALSFGWAVLTPLLLKLAEHFDGFKE